MMHVLKNTWAVTIDLGNNWNVLIALWLVYKVQTESVTGISHYMSSYVQLIMIIVNLHVFAAILDVQTLCANGTYLIHSFVCKSYNSTQKERS